MLWLKSTGAFKQSHNEVIRPAWIYWNRGYQSNMLYSTVTYLIHQFYGFKHENLEPDLAGMTFLKSLYMAVKVIK